MSRRWWIRQGVMGLGYAALSGLINFYFGHNWQHSVLWGCAVLGLGGLATLNVLRVQRWRPEKFEKFKAAQEARLRR